MTKQILLNTLASLNLPSIHYFPSIDSTNTHAMQLLETEVLEDWTLLFAEHQSAGKGRFDRTWITNPEAALAFSLVLIPTEEEQSRLEFFSALGGLAVCKTLRNHYSIESQVKYPNDVLINGKKTSGVLAEADWCDGKPSAVILGIGVNVFSGAIPETIALNFPTTCISNETPQTINRFQLLAQIIEEIQNLRKILHTTQFVEVWNHHLAYKKQAIKIILQDDEFFGICEGVDMNGNLKLKMDNGAIITYRVGDVHLRPLE